MTIKTTIHMSQFKATYLKESHVYLPYLKSEMAFQHLV